MSCLALIALFLVAQLVAFALAALLRRIARSSTTDRDHP